MKKFAITSIILFLLLLSNHAMAGSTPYHIGTLQTFLDSSYFGAYEKVTDYDFTDKWNYTAIAYESGNENHTAITVDGSTTFSTYSDGNFGQWNTVDFNSENLYFEDNNPLNIDLDPYNNTNPEAALFQIFRLTESVTLSYLDDLFLQNGTLIVGFNDNGNPSDGDADFDDIIIAMNPVPEPATMMLFGIGLLGLAGVARRKK